MESGTITMCSSGTLSKAQPHINRGADARSAVMMGWVDDLRSKGQLPSAGGSELNAQINATPKKESTPPLPKSSGDSGLSIRRSTSGSSSNTSNRRGGSRSGGRKRFNTS